MVFRKQKSDNDQLNPLDNNKVVNIAEKWNKMEKMADMMMTYMGYRVRNNNMQICFKNKKTTINLVNDWTNKGPCKFLNIADIYF